MEKNQVMSEYTRSHIVGYAQILTEIGKAYLGSEHRQEMISGQSREYMLANRQTDLTRVLFGRFILDAAGQIEHLAEEKELPSDVKLERRVDKELSRAGMILSQFYRKKNRNGYDEIGMLVRSSGKDFYNVTDLADLLSKLLHKTMLPLSDGYQYIHKECIPLLFEEDTPFQMDSGYARATKDNEVVSGDNYLLRDFGDGTFVAAIADGMGSGEQACEDSEKVLILLERFLESGLTIPELIETCNRLIYLRRDLEQSVSMDILECNQYNGQAKLYKYGAAGSYLLRGKKVRSIGPSGTALGIHADARGSVENLQFQADDILILLSDGVMDYYAQREGAFEQALSNSRVTTLEELASAILRVVIMAREGKLSDDMTVLAVQMYEKDG